MLACLAVPLIASAQDLPGIVTERDCYARLEVTDRQGFSFLGDELWVAFNINWDAIDEEPDARGFFNDGIDPGGSVMMDAVVVGFDTLESEFIYARQLEPAGLISAWNLAYVFLDDRFHMRWPSYNFDSWRTASGDASTVRRIRRIDITSTDASAMALGGEPSVRSVFRPEVLSAFSAVPESARPFSVRDCCGEYVSGYIAEIAMSPGPPEPVQIELIDPLDSSMRQGDWLVSSIAHPDRYVDGGRTVEGFAADGQTPIVVRFELDGPGTLVAELPADGHAGQFMSMFREPTGTSTQLPVRELDGRFYAFAIIQAPADFVAAPEHESIGSRDEELRVLWRRDGGTETIELHAPVIVTRPPTMLLHGLWGDYESTWSADFRQVLLDAGVSLPRVSYASTHANEFRTNIQFVHGLVRRTLDEARGRPGEPAIAVTQLDVIGHSMGGVLTRLLIAGEGIHPYFDNRHNYGAGYINRLITIATPHCGSPMASWLVDRDGTRTWFGLAMQGNDGGCVDCGAVRDLRPDIISLPSTRGLGVPSHAIVAAGGQDFVFPPTYVPLRCPPIARRIARQCDMVALFVDLAYKISFDTLSRLFSGDDHDLVVTASSQYGGLATESATVFDFIDRASEAAIHTSVAGETRVAERVLELLNSPVSDPMWADGFDTRCSDNPPPPVPPEYAGDGGIMIVGPSEGFEVIAGEAIEIEVVPFGDFLFAGGLVLGGRTAASIDAVGRGRLEVPVSASGPLHLVAVGFNAQGEAAVSEAVIGRVVVPAALQGAEIVGDEATLTEFLSEERLLVVGQYADGVERRLSPGAEVSYRSFDESVAVVSNEGVVRAIAEGATFVQVSVREGGPVYSDSIVVTVTSVPSCAPDLDGDGELTIFDFLAFQNAFDAVDPVADFDGDGEFTIFDFLAFQNAFQDGCS